MKKLILILTFAIGFASSAYATDTGCLGVSGIGTAPPPGVSCPTPATTSTYAAMGYGIVPAASATDIACITGSATKVVRVEEIRVSGNAGTLVTLPVLLTKHSVANTGGTAATTTALPVPAAIDSGNSAATATTTAYTANPTVDSTATRVDAITISLNTTSALVAGGAASFNFSQLRYSQQPTLRGVAEQLCVNLGGVSVTSGAIAVSFRWTESAH